MSSQRRRRNKRQENQPKSTSKKNKRLNNWAVFSGIGLQMGLTIYLGNLLGKWLDVKCNTYFLENIITLIAVFASMFAIINRIKKLNSDD